MHLAQIALLLVNNGRIVDPLASSRAKLLRAARHSNTVRVAMQHYVEQTLVEETIGPQVAWTQQWQTLTWDSVPEVPSQVAATFGDFLTNARAALDHAVYSLVVANGWPGSPNHTMFPMAQTEGEWRRETAERAKGEQLSHGWGLSAEALALVRCWQPLVTHPDKPSAAPLARLRLASNRDKHRMLFAAGVVPTMPVYLRFDPPGVVEVAESEPAPPGQRVRAHSSLGRVRLQLTGSGPADVTMSQAAGFDWGMFQDLDEDQPLFLSHQMREVLQAVEGFLDEANELPELARQRAR